MVENSKKVIYRLRFLHLASCSSHIRSNFSLGILLVTLINVLKSHLTSTVLQNCDKSEVFVAGETFYVSKTQNEGTFERFNSLIQLYLRVALVNY